MNGEITEYCFIIIVDGLKRSDSCDYQEIAGHKNNYTDNYLGILAKMRA